MLKNKTEGVNINGVSDVKVKFVDVGKSETEEKEEPGFYDTSHLKGKDFVKRLIHKHEQHYQKKFPFERGQYHQCIPNP